MTQSKKIPRIESISKVDGFHVYCVFKTGEHGVIDFKKLFEEWDVKSGDDEYALLDLKEFQKVKLRDGVLSWENVQVLLIKEDGTEENSPYEIDPIVLHNQAEIISDEKGKTSVLELKGDILTKIGVLEDEELLQRILLFLTQDLQVEESAEEIWRKNLPPAQQKRPPRLQESDQEEWRRSEGLTF